MAFLDRNLNNSNLFSTSPIIWGLFNLNSLIIVKIHLFCIWCAIFIHKKNISSIINFEVMFLNMLSFSSLLHKNTNSKLQNLHIVLLKKLWNEFLFSKLDTRSHNHKCADWSTSAGEICNNKTCKVKPNSGLYNCEYQHPINESSKHTK